MLKENGPVQRLDMKNEGAVGGVSYDRLCVSKVEGGWGFGAMG
jgi:hypothetical protein